MGSWTGLNELSFTMEYSESSKPKGLTGWSLEKGEQIHLVYIYRKQKIWRRKRCQLLLSRVEGWIEELCGMRSLNVFCCGAELWENLCEHLNCCWVLTLNPRPFDECLMKWALCSKCCSDLLIFGGRKQSLSKFMWPILNTFGEVVRSRNCTWFFSLAYALNFCSLGEYIFSPLQCKALEIRPLNLSVSLIYVEP